MISEILTSKNSADPPFAQKSPVDFKAIPSNAILGIRFHSISLPQTIQVLNGFVQERVPRHIILGNAYTIALSRQDHAFKTLLNKADLTLADGMSIVWGGHWIGLNLPGRVAGPDLTAALCEEASLKGYRVFFLGSTHENLAILLRVLTARWPGLIIAGSHSPSICDRLDEKENSAIMEEIHRAKPDILFVGMSAPKQEKWIAENLHLLQVPVCLGVGAAFDFLSGRIPRAPQQLQKIGLEWLYRLWCEPRRLWKRYLLGNAVFLSLLLRDALKQRFNGTQVPRLH